MRNPLAKVFAPRIKDTRENRRLAITLNERPFREMFNHELMEDVRKAKEEWFQNEVEIKRITPQKS